MPTRRGTEAKLLLQGGDEKRQPDNDRREATGEVYGATTSGAFVACSKDGG